MDPTALAAGRVRFCGNNTGNEADDHNWGEAMCFTDGTVAEAAGNTAVPEAQLFVVGTPDLAMMDNMAFQPGRGNWILHEDGDGPAAGRNNDLWACLPDGDDDDAPIRTTRHGSLRRLQGAARARSLRWDSRP